MTGHNTVLSQDSLKRDCLWLWEINHPKASGEYVFGGKEPPHPLGIMQHNMTSYAIFSLVPPFVD